MPGLPALAALLHLAAVLEPHASVVAEARAGEAPLVPREAPRAGVVGIVTPTGELQLRDGGLDIRLDYAPRFFWRQPNQSSRLRPLILHQAELTASVRPSAASTISARAAFAMGEADYSVLPRLFDPAQVMLPEVVRIASGVAGATAMLEASRALRLELTMEVAHRRPLDTVAGVMPFPRSTSASAAPGAAIRVSPRDDVLVRSGFSYATYSNGVELVTALPEVGWGRRLTSQTDLRLLGGLAYTWNLGNEIATGWLGPFSPIGSVEVDSLFLPERGRAMRLSAGVAVEHFIDPVLATAGPRGRTWVRFATLLGPRWLAGVEGGFATSLRSDPLPGNPYETVASVAVPVRHALSPWMLIEFGARWSDRAPHTQAPDFDFNQRELWVYGVLTITTHRGAGFALPGGGALRGTVTRVPTALQTNTADGGGHQAGQSQTRRESDNESTETQSQSQSSEANPADAPAIEEGPQPAGRERRPPR